jgi:glycosyltransferase involved in cell wall biosynthesis
MTGSSGVWNLSQDEQVWIRKERLPTSQGKIPLVVLLRVRNEELILTDTLSHLSEFADLIVAYDDASTDRTRHILKSHPKVGLVIENNRWLSRTEDRLISETRHRGLLLEHAKKNWQFQWCMCCDADERYVGPLAGFVSDPNLNVLPDAIRIQLFDAYITPDDAQPYQQGMSLLNFRKFFGPERRDILMLWKNNEDVEFSGLDAREPVIKGTQQNLFYCQHYGKSLSVEHWEATCRYYIDHFPFEPYGKKWSARLGRAIHTQSDFGRPVFPWGPDLFMNAAVNF